MPTHNAQINMNIKDTPWAFIGPTIGHMVGLYTKCGGSIVLGLPPQMPCRTPSVLDFSLRRRTHETQILS